MSYVQESLKAANETAAVLQRSLEQYWTPFTGHKVSVASTLAKLQDLLFVTASGQRTACSDDEQLVWFLLDCQFHGIVQDISNRN